jgi:hypothetical protein
MPLSKITNPFLDPAGAARSNVYSPSANTIGIVTAGTERVRVASGGIVAMGTTDTSNTTRLKVQGGTTAVRATSAQLTIQRNTISTEYEGICLNSGPANAAYIGRVPNSDDIIFGFDAGSSLTERVRIDASGRVTTPYQPAASVSYSGGDISATIVPLNSGPDTRGGVTISSNRITVPTTGYYVIGYHHLATTTGTQIQIRRNGSEITGGTTQANPASAHGNFSAQNVQSLTAGDYIEFHVISNTLHGNAAYNRMYLYLLG